MTENVSLKGKNIVIMGVANKRSIAWAIARAFNSSGANLAFTYQDERYKDKVERLVKKEMPGAMLIPCNVAEDSELDTLAEKLKEKWSALHVVVHSLAYAKKQELDGLYVDTSREGFLLAHNISAYSLVAASQRLYPLMSEGGSIITLTFQGSQRVVTNYNVMGVAKASLEASVRYLASDLGPQNIRVNAISAGPIRTISAKGVRDFNRLLDGVENKTPLRRLATAADVAGTALFLATDLSRSVTGSVIYTDGGYHIMGA
ncbi:MAG: enoyl-ACP reductase [Bacillota bacterium]|nr:enoyl-ACP reductase [Bacillota bacterium]